MREIKFRAWDGEKMHYDGFAVSASGIFMWVYFGTNQIYYPESEDGIPKVMKSTNLKDKSGKEIYQGDIVRGNIVTPQLLTGQTKENCSTAMGGVVEYNYAGFILKAVQSMCNPEREGNANWFPFASNDPFDGDFEDMEIIGNIYENPKLL